MSGRISATPGKPKRRRRKPKEQHEVGEVVYFIGTRPLHLPMKLRGQQVEVEVRPIVGTSTHVNYKIVIRSDDGQVLHWHPTQMELMYIGRIAGMQTEPQDTH